MECKYLQKLQRVSRWKMCQYATVAICFFLLCCLLAIWWFRYIWSARLMPMFRRKKLQYFQQFALLAASIPEGHWRWRKPSQIEFSPLITYWHVWNEDLMHEFVDEACVHCSFFGPYDAGPIYRICSVISRNDATMIINVEMYDFEPCDEHEQLGVYLLPRVFDQSLSCCQSKRKRKRPAWPRHSRSTNCRKACYAGR